MTEKQLMLIIIVLSFMYGAMTGSFFNMLAYRLKNRLSVLTPTRSFCDHCGRVISFIDLIPVFGYVLRRGKSSCCGQSINPVYPAIELFTGVVCAFTIPAMLRGLL